MVEATSDDAGDSESVAEDLRRRGNEALGRTSGKAKPANKRDGGCVKKSSNASKQRQEQRESWTGATLQWGEQTHLQRKRPRKKLPELKQKLVCHSMRSWIPPETLVSEFLIPSKGRKCYA